MADKRTKPAEIVTTLRQGEMLVGQGMPRADAVRQIGMTGQTCYRWRRKYGGMGPEQLKGTEAVAEGRAIGPRTMAGERRRRAVSDLTLDKLILTEAARGV